MNVPSQASLYVTEIRHKRTIPHQQRGSLANKLTVVMSCLAMGAVLTVSWVGFQRERIHLHQDLENQATLILDTLSAATGNALYFNHFDEAGDIINGLNVGFQTDNLLRSVRLYQTDGRLLADAFARDKFNLSLEPDPLGTEILLNGQLMTDWQPEQVLVGKPIQVGDEVVGAISLGLSTELMQANLRETLRENLWVSLIAIVCSVVLARLLSRSIIKPLKALTTATEHLSSGHWKQTISLKTNDELTTLGHAFNQMSQQLSLFFETLQLKTEELEKSQQMAQHRANELEAVLEELKQTQEQLIQQEKMASLGQMIAGIAHEINNPVTFVQGNVEPAQEYVSDLLALIELYQEKYPNPPGEIRQRHQTIDLSFIKRDIIQVLFSMRIGAERIAEIVKSLRTFSHLDQSSCKRVDVHEGLDSTILILQHRFKANGNRPEIQLIKDYGALPPIECFPSQLNQVFMNLLANALDAFEEKEVNSITADSKWRISIHTAITSDNCVLIHISDNAGGMPENVQSKIFDPFYTSKPVGKGTGLGLAICYQIITELHGGKLRCHSILGQGTTFFIEIPASQP
ncbi:MAG: ATP-binding protein [Cyanobacteria bacterium J06627_8]